MSSEAVSLDLVESDGRRLRRDRNRDAVVDALLDLYAEGNLDPSSAEIAQRAGLSPRSLFRYFDDVDDLAQAAISEQQARVVPLVDIDALPADPLSARIDRVVEQRIRVFEAMGNVGRVSRLRAPFRPVIEAELVSARAFFRAQLRKIFANELAEFGSTRGPLVLAALDSVLSFESYELMRSDQRLSQVRTAAAMTEAAVALLGAERS
jgi:TetR/AcrR family transcriptional regulator, regulator of autoinduction and epiphytic fitness